MSQPITVDYVPKYEPLQPAEIARQCESLAAALLVRFDAPEQSKFEMRELAVEIRQAILVLRRHLEEMARDAS